MSIGQTDQMDAKQAQAMWRRKTILWQDHSHPEGYQPTLAMIHFADGKKSLELDVFGHVTVIPYTKPECDCELVP